MCLFDGAKEAGSRSVCAIGDFQAAARAMAHSGCVQVPSRRGANERSRATELAAEPPASSGQPSTPIVDAASRTLPSATAYCSRRKKPLVPSIGSSVQKSADGVAAAAIDQIADFLRRGIGAPRRTKSGDLVERLDAFFEPQASA